MEGRFLLLLCTLGALAFLGTCEAGDVGTTLYAGQTLWAGNYLKSSNANYQFLMQADCNLVLYKLSDNAKVLWSSGTNNKGSGCYLKMQTDGNLVIYNSGGGAVWASNTARSSQNFRLVMQDDGNVVIYTPSYSPIWATGTNGKATVSSSEHDGMHISE